MYKYILYLYLRALFYYRCLKMVYKNSYRYYANTAKKNTEKKILTRRYGLMRVRVRAEINSTKNIAPDGRRINVKQSNTILPKTSISRAEGERHFLEVFFFLLPLSAAKMESMARSLGANEFRRLQ